MKPEELKALRASLGLSGEWCAKNVGRLKTPRSWWHWESGKNGKYPASVPDDVAARMLKLSRAIQKALE